jgi:hypothetical protein
MRLNRILVFPFFLSASWINSPNRDAFQNAQRIPWELEFDFNDSTNTNFHWIHFGRISRGRRRNHPTINTKPRSLHWKIKMVREWTAPRAVRPLSELRRIVVQHLWVDLAGRADLRFIGHSGHRKPGGISSRTSSSMPSSGWGRSRFRRSPCKYPIGTTST